MVVSTDNQQVVFCFAQVALCVKNDRSEEPAFVFSVHIESILIHELHEHRCLVFFTRNKHKLTVWLMIQTEHISLTPRIDVAFSPCAIF